MNRLLSPLPSILLVILYTILLLSSYSNAENLAKYQPGDAIKLECLNRQTMEWGPGPRCEGRKKGDYDGITFFYGKNTFLSCGIAISTKEMYEQLTQNIKQENSWECRIPLSPDDKLKIYIPVHIPVWGFVQTDHLDVTDHINVLFHEEDGIIHGATIYPVKDKFVQVKSDLRSTLTYHGHIKWLKGGSFSEISGGAGAGGGVNTGANEFGQLWISASMSSVFLWCLITFVFSILAAAIIYKSFLKPRLIRKYLKTD
ncbi:hypothetical protein DFA_03912 [Cavenderia fasciculata]|uniref:Transmembrane 9 superfamily member n=1 Tax=Cavenderia fasciculata TaxID=261658 RepID=F4Q0R7_CACFS|nr:uncharacterized protein DFA_03912 [Cavenderia fasciculata]EGG18418.1 hypothetical protein DFA_03912 [Cavenderia fasciculata]|eukprot:XP_004366322.1 hypothetical protein DFA_03912 [Cavenderia fasciculata]